MTRHHCSCGFAAEDADTLQDHLLDVFALEVDRGNDGRIHAEVITPADAGQPQHVCTCGFASEIIAEFDGHMLLVFTTLDHVGGDGRKHIVVDQPATEASGVA